ncbi:hypothetical protein GCM10023321_43860 [Pseudonocardia eucalypti]|uniref:Uncharacterized protein n=1 Tax=Pseudonocardia eucalypti TaxID=648755 RepID=A0ABP9QEY5_9PSEU|nr:hypothetical protein [Pseudonocardia eucalypti]
MLAQLAAFLTPTGVAGILGAFTGAIGGVLGALLTGAMTNSRERRSRLFAEQRVTYVAYLAAVRDLEQRAIHESGSDDLDNTPIGQLEIIASAEVRKRHREVLAAVRALVTARAQLIERLTDEDRARAEQGESISDANFTQVHNKYKAVIAKLEAAMRKDLGNTS